MSSKHVLILILCLSPDVCALGQTQAVANSTGIADISPTQRLNQMTTDKIVLRYQAFEGGFLLLDEDQKLAIQESIDRCDIAMRELAELVHRKQIENPSGDSSDLFEQCIDQHKSAFEDSKKVLLPHQLAQLDRAILQRRFQQMLSSPNSAIPSGSLQSSSLEDILQLDEDQRAKLNELRENLSRKSAEIQARYAKEKEELIQRLDQKAFEAMDGEDQKVLKWLYFENPDGKQKAAAKPSEGN